MTELEHEKATPAVGYYVWPPIWVGERPAGLDIGIGLLLYGA